MNARLSSERIVNVAIVVAALIVTATYAKSWLVRVADSSSLGMKPTYDVGETLPLTLAAVQDSRAKAVVVFINSHCHFCTESMPFYRALMQRRAKSRAVVVAVSRESESDLTNYAKSHGVSFDRVVSVGLSDVKLHATPTLFVTDSEGRVLKRWLGEMGTSEQNELLAMLE